MCGRFSFDIDHKELKTRYPYHKITPVNSIFNFAPSMSLPIIITNHVIEMKWGLVPYWAKNKAFKPLINARGETINEKPSFKHLVDSNRCLIISNGFYEWNTKTKKPYFIQPANSKIMTFGGLFDMYKEKENDKSYTYTFTILTTEANEKLSGTHHRMPLILKKEEEHEWIMKKPYNEVKHLIKPLASDEVNMQEISTLVNSTKNNTSEIQNKILRLL
tara:strand:+ start:1819 stop:2472 length:654 start_codon:yes stop_codon:yes gene_type:complete